jgi:hypothetical protein
VDYSSYGSASYDQEGTYDQQYWNQGGMPPPMAAPFIMPGDVHKSFPYAGAMGNAGMLDDSGLGKG